MDGIVIFIEELLCFFLVDLFLFSGDLLFSLVELFIDCIFELIEVFVFLFGELLRYLCLSLFLVL